MPPLSKEEFLKLPEEKQVELSGAGESKPGKVLSKEEFHALPEEHQVALASGKPIPNAEEENNDRLLMADPMTLPANERQQAMALQQGAPPQYSKKQMDQGRKAEMTALGAMAAGALAIPAGGAPARAAVRLTSPGSTGGILPEVFKAGASAAPAKSMLGEAISHYGGHALEHVAPWLKGGSAAGAAMYGIEKAGGAIERRLHHFLK